MKRTPKTPKSEKIQEIQKKHEFGQYFTTDNTLKEKVWEFIQNNPGEILEPSVGRGDLVAFIQSKKPQIVFDMYEIDGEISLLENVPRERVVVGDFMKQTISRTYKTIVGNPPYIRTKNGNLYIDFTEKCFHLLEENGELIFIVPSDFLKLTSSCKLLHEMMIHGCFTHIYHPHNENLFENASIDVLLFRYCKNASLPRTVIYNDQVLYLTDQDGLITFHEKNPEEYLLIHDCFDICVGMVSGKEEVYKNAEIGNREILNGEKKVEKYIYIEKYPCENEEINRYLFEHKEELMGRGIRNFNENNWFEWGAPRNIATIENNWGVECIYVYNLTRKSTIAFAGKVQYFGGSLLMMIPKKKYELQPILDYLNSPEFKHNFTFSGRFKIGHHSLSNSLIPKECILSD